MTTITSHLRLLSFWINAAILFLSLPCLASGLQAVQQPHQFQQQQQQRVLQQQQPPAAAEEEEEEKGGPVITQTINTFEVLERISHDGNAFTQGLTFDPASDGSIVYESTGLYGQSDIRQVDLKNDPGKVLKIRETPPEIFGEGLAFYPPNKLIHITWKKRRGFIFDATTFEILEEFQYKTSNNEGWGITYNPIDHIFIVTDGSHYLHFWNADTLEEVDGGESSRVPVTMQLNANEDPTNVVRLNEIEWDPRTSTILANIWLTDYIVRIDPTTGYVLKRYDLKNLYMFRIPPADVLNGIAISPNNNNHDLWITGKKWPHMYRLRLGDEEDDTTTNDDGSGGDGGDSSSSSGSGSPGSSSGNGDIDGCFSASGTVEVMGKGIVFMKDLNVGDKVRTTLTTTSGHNNDNNHRHHQSSQEQEQDYEIVYAFGHYAPETRSEFLLFSFSIATTNVDGTLEEEQEEETPSLLLLEVTKEHLLYLHSKSNPVRADSIVVGDILQGSSATSMNNNNNNNNNNSTMMMMMVVQNIEKVQRTGLYAPLTPSGTIIVNGILASTYISLQGATSPEYVQFNINVDRNNKGGGNNNNNNNNNNLKLMTHQDLAHWFLTPFRWFCCFHQQQQQQGRSRNRNTSTSTICHSYNDRGIPPYIAAGINLARWILQEEKSSLLLSSSLQLLLPYYIALVLLLVAFPLIGLYYYYYYYYCLCAHCTSGSSSLLQYRIRHHQAKAKQL